MFQILPKYCGTLRKFLPGLVPYMVGTTTTTTEYHSLVTTSQNLVGLQGLHQKSLFGPPRAPPKSPESV